jgi:integrase
MSVRKRQWRAANGEIKTAWVCDYFDGSGKRRNETFATKGQAVARHAQVVLDVMKGMHVVHDGKATIADAARRWLQHLEAEGRERATIAQYDIHLRLHVLPVLGRVKLAKLNAETIESFRAFLLAKGETGEPVRSRDLAVKVWVTFKTMLKHAHCAHLGQGVSGITRDHRHTRRLEIGVDVPTNNEIKRLFEATAGARPEQTRKRALLLVAAFCGLRASELRGLRWADAKLDEAELQITQRADRYGKIGSPKSASSRRTIPMSPDVVEALKLWKVAQGRRCELVFSTRLDGVEPHGNMVRSLKPVMRAAGMVTKNGKPRYALHAFRHYFASWCISPKERGGRGLSPKVVQEWLGHSTIVMTLDTYGHLFKEVDKSELATATASVLA